MISKVFVSKYKKRIKQQNNVAQCVIVSPTGVDKEPFMLNILGGV